MKLVITEKPDMGRTLAKFLNANEKGEGYFKNDQYYVTWARGHCIKLADPSAYGFEKWNMADLPIIPDQFKLVEIKDTNKEFKAIRKLMENSSVNQIINATDAEREGELIFRLIYDYVGSSLPVDRLWITNKNEEAIEKAFNNLKPQSEYDGYYWSAKSRSLADWLVGFNSTRAFTMASDANRVLSLGRVQTPVLALICSRFIINRDFKEIVKYHIKADFEKDGVTFSAICEAGKESSSEVEQIIKNDLGSFSVVSIKSSEEKKSPPTLFDIGIAQSFANKHLNLTASETLAHIQNLYEKKLVTYPRTDSAYLNSNMKDEVRDIQSKLAGLDFLPSSEVAKVVENPLYEKPFNDSKVSDHHAIIPTGVLPEDLAEKELEVYQMIVNRFFAAFAGSRIRTKTQVNIKSGDYEFVANGSENKVNGWAGIEIQGLPKEVRLPDLSEAEILEIKTLSPHIVKSKPPALYTDGTLITAMESAGKKVENIEMREAMKSRGLGTGATRHTFIDLLIDRSYIERKGKSLIPTALGLSVYGKVKNFPIASPEMTGDIELKLNKMLNGEYSHEAFLEEMKGFTKEITSALSGSGITIDRPKCPCCSKGKIFENEKSFYCSQYKDESDRCGFTIWKVTAGKKLSSGTIQEILTKGTTKKLKGFKKKDGGTFDTILKVNKTKRTLEMVFDNKGQKGKK